jgi:hypothetical protein
MGNADNSQHAGVPGTGGLLSSCAQRGATAATFDCRYGWWFESDSMGNQSPIGPYSDNLGFCIDVSKYTFTDQTTMMQDPFKLCSALPKMAPSATDPYGSAKDWGCTNHDFVTGFEAGKIRKPNVSFRVANGAMQRL